MASLVAFHYQPRATAVHGVDARFKLPLFLLLVAVALHSGAVGLLILSLFAAVSFGLSRLPAVRIAREFRLFAVLLAVMFIARSLGDGSAAPGFSRAGVIAAAVLVWKLSLLLILGTLLAGTSRVSHLQTAVAWYLRPIPLVPEGRIATMVGLTISLIPLLFDSYREIADAQAARCIRGAHNPIRRLRSLAIPLMLKTFGRADHIAAAMESRCYSDDRSFARLASRPSDWVALILVVLVAGLALTGDRLL